MATKLEFSNNDFLLGEDPRTIELFDRIKGVARIGDNPVLVRGETGVGKEGIARAIHHNSPRQKSKLVIVNCASITDSLADSEWFGHTKGAFTGADKAKAGVFEEANKGVIFLDEVGDLTPLSQTKLLRVLQEMEVRKVGSNKTQQIDLRVVSATNKDLPELARRGEFRLDLYYRLAGEQIVVPPLRERPADIITLAECFVRKIAEKYSKHSLEMTEPVRDLIKTHDWPGNVRELRQTIEAAALQCIREGKRTIEVRHLPDAIRSAYPVEPEKSPQPYEVEKLLDAILELLRKKSPRTLVELARNTGRNGDAVRRHVGKLSDRGLARIEKRRGPGGTRIYLN